MKGRRCANWNYEKAHVCSGNNLIWSRWAQSGKKHHLFWSLENVDAQPAPRC